MFYAYRPDLQSKNFVDGLIFTGADPCIWVVYPAGAVGDLLIAILDKHYLRTGCEYYGINDRGRVMIYTSDYEMIDVALSNKQEIEFNDRWFYDFSEQLGKRNLTYSMLDQIIFGCHLYRPGDIHKILQSFPQAKIINIYAKDNFAQCVINTLATYKLKNVTPRITPFELYQDNSYSPKLVQHDQVLNIPFGFLFDRQSYDTSYTIIRDFLGIPAPLISFDFVEFYLSKQHPVVLSLLKQCNQTL